jgi:hypothetical protein
MRFRTAVPGNGGRPENLDCVFESHCGTEPVYHHATHGDRIGIKPVSEFCAWQKSHIGLLLELLEQCPVKLHHRDRQCATGNEFRFTYRLLSCVRWPSLDNKYRVLTGLPPPQSSAVTIHHNRFRIDLPQGVAALLTENCRFEKATNRTMQGH